MSAVSSFDVRSRFRVPRYSLGWTVRTLRADLANATKRSEGRRRAA